MWESEENYRPLAPEQRGRHSTFGSALGAAFKDLVTERNEFFDSLVDRWQAHFADIPARPGRYENGKIYLYVKSAPLLYALRPRLRAIAKRLLELPGAPKRIDLRLEIHSRRTRSRPFFSPPLSSGRWNG